MVSVQVSLTTGPIQVILPSVGLLTHGQHRAGGEGGGGWAGQVNTGQVEEEEVTMALWWGGGTETSVQADRAGGRVCGIQHILSLTFITNVDVFVFAL